MRASSEDMIHCSTELPCRLGVSAFVWKQDCCDVYSITCSCTSSPTSDLVGSVVFVTVQAGRGDFLFWMDVTFIHGKPDGDDGKFKSDWLVYVYLL